MNRFLSLAFLFLAAVLTAANVGLMVYDETRPAPAPPVCDCPPEAVAL